LSDVPEPDTNTPEQIDDFRAKLSVVADSSHVQVYSIDRRQMTFIPDHLQKIFREGLAEYPDFDDFAVNEMKKEINIWNHFKEKETFRTLQETYTMRLKEQKRSDYKKF